MTTQNTQPAAAANTPVKILFVDDEQLILNALKRTLRREGFELFFTSDPFEVQKLVGQHRVDVVVSDHMMPQMTGVEVLALVRRLHPHTLRIMMTGQADRDATIRAINEGNINRFIEKPWDDTMLKNVLHEAARSIMVQRAANAQPDVAAAVKTFHRTILRDATGAIVIHGVGE
ncbi:MAG TPA: response regulator [Myxococcota bacterium]|jgi:response regulator RpfG family c-di-GMP phosphodiesterase